MFARCLLIICFFIVSCGSESTENNANSTTNTTTAPDNSANNDPTCEVPCPVGEVQEFGTCEAASCVTRMACGAEVVCRDQAACLAVSSCADGGLPLEACPANSQGCLPQMICGATKYCQTLQQCARDACDGGESATSVGCDDPSITLPCREVTACGAETVTCVCRAEDLFCDEEETFDTAPCDPGQICREVMGCGTIFYCKGGSI